jgi:hypothetical protein
MITVKRGGNMSGLRTVICMRRQLLAALCCFFLILLTGCPYESGSPLSDPAGSKIDEGLLGGWRATDKEGHEVGTITVSRFNNGELLIVLEEKGKPQERQMMRGFVTQIDGAKFLNLQEMKGSYETRRWMFARYTTGDCSLTYRMLNDSFDPEGKDGLLSSERLHEQVKKNLANSHLYDEEETLTCLRK